MPGKDRWRALAPELIAPACVRMSPDEFDDTTDRSGLALDADGTLKPLRAVRAALLPRKLTLSPVELDATVVRQVFLDCDRDRSGFLSRAEFAAAMARLNCDAGAAVRPNLC